MHCIKTLGFVMVLVGYAMAIPPSIVSIYYPRERPILHEADLADELDDEPITEKRPVEIASYPISVKPADETELPQQPDLAIKAAEEKGNVQNKNEETDGGNLRIARALGSVQVVYGPPHLDGSFSRRLDEIFGSPIRKEGKHEDDDDEEFYK